MEPKPASQPEPSPSEKFQRFTAKILSVPKEEIDRREAEYQKGRDSTRPQRKAGP